MQGGDKPRARVVRSRAASFSVTLSHLRVCWEGSPATDCSFSLCHPPPVKDISVGLVGSAQRPCQERCCYNSILARTEEGLCAFTSLLVQEMKCLLKKKSKFHLWLGSGLLQGLIQTDPSHHLKSSIIPPGDSVLKVDLSALPQCSGWGLL